VTEASYDRKDVGRSDKDVFDVVVVGLQCIHIGKAEKERGISVNNVKFDRTDGCLDLDGANGA
jgi:hypothetical protein